MQFTFFHFTKTNLGYSNKVIGQVGNMCNITKHSMGSAEALAGYCIVNLSLT